MTGIPGKWKPAYTLYLRRRDRAVRVVRAYPPARMPVRACYPSSRGIAGLFVEFYRETAIFVLDEEVVLVEEFPA